MAPTIKELHAALTAPGQPFEMAKARIRGQSLRVWKNTPPHLRAIFETSRAWGDAPYIVYEDERLSYAEHYRRVVRLAHALVDDFGVRRGDRVAIAMRNFPEWAVAFWATTAIGAVTVPLNAWWKGEELTYGLTDSGSVVLIADQERDDRLAPHYADLGLRGVIVARAAEELTPGHQEFEDVLARHAGKDQLPPAEIDPEDDATIFYTSGTTGFPKGALGSHRNICTNLMSLMFIQLRSALRMEMEIPPPEEAPKPAALLSVPMFHATGCHSTVVPVLAQGGKIVLMYRWDPERALELVEREKLHRFGGVPGMVWQVLESPNLKKYDLSSVTSIGYGGAPAASELVRRIKAAFPDVSPSNGYGLTETSSVTTMNPGIDYVERPDSVGPAVPVCDLRVVGDDGRDVPAGGLGELWIRGPNVVKGYWNKPEATAEAITDGWLHSGDIARLDEDGFVYIVDRAKDMILRGGENIYCVEVENVLYAHPDVTDAAVIGLPHPVLGEEVGAVVKLQPGAHVTEQQLRDHVAAHLAAFKVPVRIEIRDVPLPRNPNGKILKRQLRDEVIAAHPG